MGDDPITHVVALRSVLTAVEDPSRRRRLARVIRQLRRSLGAGIPKHRAASCLGVSRQALESWVRAGAVPVVRRPGSSRELIERDAVLALAAEIERLRAAGYKRPLGRAVQAVGGRRRLRPNQPAAELRREYLATTSAGRLRSAVELSRLGAALGQARRRPRR